MDVSNPFNSPSPNTLATGQCLKSRRSGYGRRGVRAQTTVEFALIALPFFVILFALIDYAQIYFYENSLQNALREASRFATSGRIIPVLSGGSNVYITNQGVGMVQAIPSAYGSDPQGSSRNECIRDWFQSNCVLQLPASNITIVSAPTLDGVPPNITTNGFPTLLNQDGVSAATPGPGGANDYVQITATYTLRTITPIMGFLSGYDRGSINTYPIRVSAIVKNEPALLNFLHTNLYSGEP